MELYALLDVHDAQEREWIRYHKANRSTHRAIRAWGDDLIKKGEDLKRLADLFEGKRLHLVHQTLSWDIDQFSVEGDQALLIQAGKEGLIDVCDLDEEVTPVAERQAEKPDRDNKKEGKLS